jgi:glycine/D-amino acid oxidase-like deaminating enzyme
MEVMDNRTVGDPESSATEVRDLRTGIAVWRAYASSPIPFTSLSSSMKTDVIVVGAGITGALVAEALTRRGLATVVLDRRIPARGSTAASTALVQFEIDTPLIRLADQIGFERASRVWRRSFRAVQDLQCLVDELRIQCDFRPRRALYLCGSALGSRELAEEGRQRRAIGLPSIFLDSSELHRMMGMNREGALLSDGVADVDPMRLTAGLLHNAMSRGGRLFAPVQLAEVVPSARQVVAVTADGIELEAKSLIYATGYELPDRVPATGHRRSSTWAFATPPQPENLWHDGELIWEASRPYLYIRTTIDGRVLAGGEDENIDAEARRDALLPIKIQALQQKVKELLPKIDVEADFAWAGTFGESDNGLPSFGPVPDMPNCYAVLGYGGNGFTFSLVAAQVVATALCGERDPDAELFDFGRP